MRAGPQPCKTGVFQKAGGGGMNWVTEFALGGGHTKIKMGIRVKCPQAKNTKDFQHVPRSRGEACNRTGCIRGCTCAYIHVDVSICVRVSVHMNVYVCVHTCECGCVRMYVYVSMRRCINMCVSLYVCGCMGECAGR